MKIGKTLAIILSLSIILASSAVGFICVNKKNDDEFLTELSAIYQQYDSNINREAVKENKFEINRLVAVNYDGRSYGEIDRAYDRKNSFAVLQFENASKTEEAYKQMKEDGITVDADGFAGLDSYEIGEMHPIGSKAIGTKEFVDSYAMTKDEVLVAVIDTGVMLDHPDLKDRFYNDGYDFSSDGFDNAYYDTKLETQYYLHSTFVSGIIANNTMDNVKIVPYKVVPFGESEFEASSVIASINHAVDLGVDVINISLSTYSLRDVFAQVIKNATDNGVCVCSSSGNRGELISACPSVIPETIAVGALNKACNSVASFSCYGPTLDFVAPGSHIVSTVPTENGAGYGEYSGTSFSAPYVAAACANIKSMNSSLSRNEVYDILCDFATDLGDEGWDDYYGNGVPNLSSMIYTDSESYSFRLPQGDITISGFKDFTIQSQPWKSFAQRVNCVNVLDSVNEIGDYCFYGLSNASFRLPLLKSVGDYAFFGCKRLPDLEFEIDVEKIGAGAFADIRSDYTIAGYRNTPAEKYALSEGISFNSLGCKHNYCLEIVEPENDVEGYTVYTCMVCGDEYVGAYIEPIAVSEGKCGDNAFYTLYNTGKLVISGSGEMYAYVDEAPPFDSFKDEITRVYITDDVSSVSPFAFASCGFIKEFRSDSKFLKIVDGSIYSTDEKELFLAFGADYAMPASVERFDAGAFLFSDININDSFTVDGNLVYDSLGNIVMALPEYSESVLTIENEIKINDYAFILTAYPNAVRSYADELILGDYSVGYLFDNALLKGELSFYGYDNTSAFEYAVNNDFPAYPLNAGECGENLSWRFDLDTYELSVYGTGNMYKYSDKETIPWYDYMQDITSILIGDEVNSLSIYSFFSAYNVKKITVPMSLSVVDSQTVWYGCQNAESIELTQGTGVIPNYGSANRSRVYTYSPWYPSRNSLKSITISDGVKSIGKYAFRECNALESINLNNCDVISDCAFYNAQNLKSVAVNNRSVLIGADAFYGVNPDFVLSAYCDSTAKDYARANNIGFNSLGCEHSRGLIAKGERAPCCYDSQVSYACVDCDEVTFSEFVKAMGNGHFVKGEVTALNGAVIKNADVYIDSVLCAKTNHYGRFVAEEIKCEEKHIVEIYKNGLQIVSGIVETNGSNVMGELSVRFGDYISDGVVNAKDYAYALKNNFDDKGILDYGRLNVENSLDISKAYSVQYAPRVLTVYNEQNAEVSYRRSFYSEITYNKDYEIEECGFIFGKNMDDEFLILENVGKKNSEGFELKKSSVTEVGAPVFRMDYGSSSKTGKLSARFFIKYTNGVRDYLVYSDITSYTYE